MNKEDDFSKLEYLSLRIPASWKARLKDHAQEKGVTINKIICDTLQRKFRFKEKKRAWGRPKKFK